MYSLPETVAPERAVGEPRPDDVDRAEGDQEHDMWDASGESLRAAEHL